MMRFCGSNNLEKGATNFSRNVKSAWPNLNTCLAKFRHSQKEEHQNERMIVIVLGLMEDKCPDEDPNCDIEDTNDGKNLPLAVHRQVVKRGGRKNSQSTG